MAQAASVDGTAIPELEYNGDHVTPFRVPGA